MTCVTPFNDTHTKKHKPQSWHLDTTLALSPTFRSHSYTTSLPHKHKQIPKLTLVIYPDHSYNPKLNITN